MPIRRDDLVDDDAETRMSDRDRQFAELISQHVTARMLASATNPEIAGRVIETWGGQIQRIVGRAVLRLALYLVILAVGIGSWKFGLLDKILGGRGP